MLKLRALCLGDLDQAEAIEAEQRFRCSIPAILMGGAS